MANVIQSTKAASATMGLALATVFTIQAIMYVRLLKQQQRRYQADSSESGATSKGGESSSGGPAVDDGNAASSGIIDKSVVTVTLPAWVHESDYFTRTYPTREDRMALAIHLSARNVAEDTGGPFGCAIFERRVVVTTDGGEEDTAAEYRLVSVGVNRVVPLGNSTLHGETVAIQMAQRAIGNYTLRGVETKAGTESGGGKHFDMVEDEKKGEEELEQATTTTTTTTYSSSYEMYSSCEPCAMCLGATLWSGVSRIVCGASKDDAASIGFDEGPVFEESYDHLRSAGVAVERCVLREEAAAVLRSYGESGIIYNR